MKRVSCAEGTFVVDGNQVRYELPLSYVKIHHYEEYSEAVPYVDFAVPFTFEQDHKDGVFRIFFEIDPGHVPLEKFRLAPELIAILPQLILIGQYYEHQQQEYTFWQPINWVVSSEGQVKMLFRGVDGLFPQREQTPIFDLVKHLLFYLLSSLTIGEIVRLGKDVWTQLHPNYASLGKKIVRATTWEELVAIDFSPVEEIAEVVPVKPEPKQNVFPGKLSRKFSFQPKWLAIGLGVLALVTPYLLPEKQNVKQAKPKSQPVVYEQPAAFIAGMREAALGNYDAATKQFQAVPYAKLAPENRRVVLYTYIKRDQWQQAVDLDPVTATEIIVDNAESNDQLKKLLNVKGDSPVLRFEQAAIQGKLKEVLALQSKVPLTERRGKIIVRAYLFANQKEKALAFAEGTGNEAIIAYTKKQIGD
jgi:hypothetical protein